MLMRLSKLRHVAQCCLGLSCWILISLSVNAAQEIIFWHSMAGQLGEEVARVSAQFNAAQTDYHVKPVYKGDYVESLTSFAAAFRAKHPPNLVQVFEVGTSAMRAPEGIIKPVETLMREQGLPLHKEQLYPEVLHRYSSKGTLLAFPFNVSIPVMFYNADVLTQFGVNEANFPNRWIDLEHLAKRLREAGYSCVYTSAYPAWILVESYQALHGLNFSSLSHLPQIAAHLQRMRRWQTLHYFEYGGRGDDPTALFTSGNCLMFSQSSGAYQSLKQLVPFRVGVAALPVEDSVQVNRQNNVVGGAALWVPAGQPKSIERGIAKFLAFISTSQVQEEWFEHTGYLPMNHALQYPSNIILQIAAHDLNQPEKMVISTQAGGENQIRIIYDQMLEAIFSGMMPVDQAIERAQARIQHVLNRFKKNTS